MYRFQKIQRFSKKKYLFVPGKDICVLGKDIFCALGKVYIFGPGKDIFTNTNNENYTFAIF
jgi:hypothetical protein